MLIFPVIRDTYFVFLGGRSQTAARMEHIEVVVGAIGVLSIRVVGRPTSGADTSGFGHIGVATVLLRLSQFLWNINGPS